MKIKDLEIKLGTANRLKPTPRIDLTRQGRTFGIKSETGKVLAEGMTINTCFQWLSGYCTFGVQSHPVVVFPAMTITQIKQWANSLELKTETARLYRDALNLQTNEGIRDGAIVRYTNEGAVNLALNIVSIEPSTTATLPLFLH